MFKVLLLASAHLLWDVEEIRFLDRPNKFKKLLKEVDHDAHDRSENVPECKSGDLDSHVDINSWFLSGHGLMWMPSLLLELRDEYPEQGYCAHLRVYSS